MSVSSDGGANGTSTLFTPLKHAAPLRGVAAVSGIWITMSAGCAVAAFALASGGFPGAVAMNISRLFIADPIVACGLVFSFGAVMLVIAALIGMRVRPSIFSSSDRRTAPSFGEIAMVEVLNAR